MVPNFYMSEKIAHEHRQLLLREAEQNRRVAEGQPAAPLHPSRRLAAKLGKYLVLVGTRLQHAQVVE